MRYREIILSACSGLALETGYSGLDHTQGRLFSVANPTVKTYSSQTSPLSFHSDSGISASTKILWKVPKGSSCTSIGRVDSQFIQHTGSRCGRVIYRVKSKLLFHFILNKKLNASRKQPALRGHEFNKFIN